MDCGKPGSQCVKQGPSLFMCDRVSHLLLPYSRIRRRNGRWLVVWPLPPWSQFSLSQDVRPLQSLGLKSNLELCTVNYIVSPGNNTPRYCIVGKGGGVNTYKLKWMVWIVTDTCTRFWQLWDWNSRSPVSTLKWGDGLYTHWSSGICSSANK